MRLWPGNVGGPAYPSHMTQRPWPNSAIRRLGVALRADSAAPPDVPSYEELSSWYLGRTVEIQSKLATIDWSPILGNQSARVTSRVKTRATLVEKLRRHPKAALQTIRDIAGVRFEASMSLTTQDAVTETIANLFDGTCVVEVLDLRDAHHFGYRAKHLELRFDQRGWRAEIQVRTDLQATWANLYEVAADVFGRSIRYAPVSPDDPSFATVNALQSLSLDFVAPLESQLDAVTAQELIVEDIRRLHLSGDLEGELNKLASIKSSTEPAKLALTQELQRLTHEFEKIRGRGA